jgi:hypothetical protein
VLVPHIDCLDLQIAITFSQALSDDFRQGIHNKRQRQQHQGSQEQYPEVR